MTSLTIATRNSHKVHEIRQILGGAFAVADLTAHPEIPAPVESGITFEENAIIKALAVSRECEGLIMADDSGLEVDALGGAPGVVSARYAGADATDEENIAKLQRELTRSGQTSRSARFCCVIALASGDKILGIFSGFVEGAIVDSPRGRGGFGYDPIFQPRGFNQTFGEMDQQIKNRISHRGKAIAALRGSLPSLAV